MRTYLESYKKELDTYQSELLKYNSEQNSKINELRGRLIVVESNLNESKSELNRLEKELDLLRPELKSLTDSLNSIHNNYPEVRNFITSVFQSLSPESIDHDLKTSHYRDGREGIFIDSTSFLSKVRLKENLPKNVIWQYRQDFEKGDGYNLEKILFIQPSNISKWESQDIMNEKREWVETRWIEIKSPHRYSVYVITGIGTYEGPGVDFVEVIEVQEFNGKLKITNWKEIDVVEQYGSDYQGYYKVENPYDYEEYLELIKNR